MKTLRTDVLAAQAALPSGAAAAAAAAWDNGALDAFDDALRRAERGEFDAGGGAEAVDAAGAALEAPLRALLAATQAAASAAAP
jgi:hypothetical protein